ncbi:hypothetical protein [Microbacter margulisiae]|uniref:Uncharacterized protein n=1 Tax=Microbacter margulisiae TaxID=1350067 RepID=A0A7W5DT56_9PORP|nr:hypothetical protein [Microbacter margulisiae]MBB3188288.1 hypothetical protein [Microbacter margulisiae]
MPASEILLKIHTDTKEEEREIIEQFLKRLQYSPTSLVTSECPDYEIEIDSKLIGVEITKYYSDFTRKGSMRQKKLSEWKKFVDELKKRLSAVEPAYDYLYGVIHFHNDQVNYRELLNDNYFNEIVKVIKSAKLNRGEQKTEKVSHDKFPILSNYIDSISLCDKYPEKKYLWWDSCLQSGEILQNETAIQEIVDKKEKSSKKYKNNYIQKWLIIYAGGLSLHDMFIFEMQNTLRQGEISLMQLDSKERELILNLKSDYFTHIFIWDKFTERIFQLYPYTKKILDFGERKIWINHLPLKE